MRKKLFRELCVEAIEKADEILEKRDNEYNREEIEIADYFNCIDDPEKAAFVLVSIKILRLKSHILGKRTGEKHKRIEDILDAINYLRFMYALINSEE